MLHRIYFDSNSGDELQRFDLSIPGSLQDIDAIRPLLKIGMHVILYQRELDVEAVLDFDNANNRWVASPIWSTLRLLPDGR
jgi:hypothetical protein